ncbi:hypothetical protein CLOLEP_03533 [[Clostridium] leptum DSM 753]|uniref:Uncharacterized protein n=1 Tax=[Clostridium] leptum DSM 753 TaxID=428125 RepID=A7VY57_9FIRM|nr:hypothetical protein CLOLEP_03533 [[Clostridium] leptum DSM 753]
MIILYFVLSVKKNAIYINSFLKSFGQKYFFKNGF